MRRSQTETEAKGLIMDITGNTAVVLTPSGEFRQVPLDHSSRRVGEEMPLPGAISPALRRPLALRPVTVALAVAALLLVTLVPPALRHILPGGMPGGTPPVAQHQTEPLVLAYVTVDINPSVELGVDAAGRVVTARPLNDDAKALLKGFEFADRPLDDVLEGLADTAVGQGYLAADRENAVIIAAVPSQARRPLPDGITERLAAGEARARRAIERHKLRAEVAALQAPHPQLKDEAAQADLSMGKYLIYLEAQKAGVSVTPEELRDAPIGRILKERAAAQGLNPGEIISRAQQERDFEGLAEEFRPVHRPDPGPGSRPGLGPGPLPGLSPGPLPGLRPGSRPELRRAGPPPKSDPRTDPRLDREGEQSERVIPRRPEQQRRLEE